MTPKSKKDPSQTKRVKKQKDPEVNLFVDDIDTSTVHEPVIDKEPSVKELVVDIDENKESSKVEDNSTATFSFDKPIYLQIHRQNIFQYFISGLISPICYEKNRPQSDIQSALREYLQLSNGLLDDLKKDDALIEISLNKTERNNLKIISSIGLLSKPIPISRIKKIYLSSDFAKTDVLATAQSTDGGVIPYFLINGYIPDNLEIIVQDEQVKSIDQVEDHTYQIAEFDRVLGAYAFVKNVQLLISNNSNVYSNYSDQYLAFVRLLLQDQAIPSVINSTELNFYKQLLGLRDQDGSPVLKWLFDRAKNGVNFTSGDIMEFGNILLKSHPDKDFKEKGKEALGILNDGIKRKSAPNYILKSIEHKDKIYLYLFSFLYIYGNKTSEDRTNARIGVANDAAIYPEFIYSLLGYFYGYSLLRNKDEKQSYIDTTFNKYAQNLLRPLIKFELTTLFDFHLIEAIYQYVFNGSKSIDKFEYIKPKGLPVEKLNYPVNLSAEYDFSHFEVLGKQFFKLVRKSIEEELIKKLSFISNDISVVSDIGLYCIRNGIKFKWNLNSVLSIFSDIKKIRSIATINKSDLVEHIGSGKCHYDELSQRIDNSIKYKDHE